MVLGRAQALGELGLWQEASQEAPACMPSRQFQPEPELHSGSHLWMTRPKGHQEKEVQRQEDQEGKYGGLEQGGGTVEEEI